MYCIIAAMVIIWLMMVGAVIYLDRQELKMEYDQYIRRLRKKG